MAHSNSMQNNIRNLKFLADDVKTVGDLLLGKHLAPYIGLVGYENLGDEVLYEAHKVLFPGHELTPYRQDSILVEKITKPFKRSYCSHAILGGGTLINVGDIWLEKAEHLLNQGSQMFCIGTGAEVSEFYGKDDTVDKLLGRWAKVLSQFEFVGVRGPQSKSVLENIGVKNVLITGDTALTLTEDDFRPASSQGKVGITYGDVAGNPMWGDSKVYRDELVKIIKAILSSGSKVVLLPIWRDDVPSNKALLDIVNNPNCSMAEVYHSYSAFAGKLRECDMFIGQKLHSSIFALMNRVPTIMIEYRPKCRDFMASIGMEEYTIRTSEVEYKPFMELYDKVQKNHSNIQARAEGQTLAFKYEQKKYADKLSAILEH